MLSGTLYACETGKPAANGGYNATWYAELAVDDDVEGRRVSIAVPGGLGIIGAALANAAVLGDDLDLGANRGGVLRKVLHVRHPAGARGSVRWPGRVSPAIDIAGLRIDDRVPQPVKIRPTAHSLGIDYRL